MPRGIPNKKPAQPAAYIRPLIILEPGDDAIQLTSYGLDAPDLIDALRRVLLHLVAQQSGLPIIQQSVADDLVVAVPARAPSSNGVDPKRTAKPAAKPTTRRRRADPLADRAAVALVNDMALDDDDDPYSEFDS